MGSKTQTTTQNATSNTAPPAELLAQYQALLKQAQGVAGSAPTTNANLQGAYSSFGQIPGQYLPQATQYAQQAASPITAGQIANYSNPFQQSVIDATMGNINETNAQQQNQVVGNAIAQGALGGNRVGVAQAELARQQGLANNQTFAGLNAGNYSQALQAAQADRSAAAQGAGLYAGLQGTAEQGAQGQLQAGAAELQQPYQPTNWMASILGGLGPLEGGTSTTSGKTTQPGPSFLSSLLGLGTAVVGALPAGALATGGRINYDGGGAVPNQMAQAYGFGGIPNFDYEFGRSVGEPGVSAMPRYAPIQTAQNSLFDQLMRQGATPPPTSSGSGSSGNSGVSSGIGSLVGAIYGNANATPVATGDPMNILPMIAQTASGGAVPRKAGGGGMGGIGVGAFPMQNSNVHRMVASALDIARTMKGGIGAGDAFGGAVMPDQRGIFVPRGYDGGGIVPDFSNEFGGSLPSPDMTLPTLPVYAPAVSGRGLNVAQAMAPTPVAAAAPAGTTGGMADTFDPSGGATQAGMSPADPGAGGIATPPAKGGYHPWSIPLIAAGLGMMASRSPFLGQAIGEGGLQGLQAYQQHQQFERQMAMAKSMNDYRNARIDMEGQRLDLMAKNEQDRLKLETQNAGKAEPREVTDAAGNKTIVFANPVTREITDASGKPWTGPAASALAADAPPDVPSLDTPDKPDAQKAYLAWVSGKYGPQVAKQVSAIADGSQDITKVTSARGQGGIPRQVMSQLVTGLEPNWSTSLATRRGAVLKDLQSSSQGSLGQSVASMNNFVKHASDAYDVIDKLGLSDIPVIGGPINQGKYFLEHKTGTNAPLYAKYETAGQGMSNEFGKLMHGSGILPESEVNRWQSRFTSAAGYGPAALKATFQEAAEMVAQIIATKHQQIADAFGGSRPDLQAFLKPNTVEALKKFGIDPETYDPKYSDYANVKAEQDRVPSVAATPPSVIQEGARAQNRISGHTVTRRGGQWIDDTTGQSVQ